jgi:hypothetical protein
MEVGVTQDKATTDPMSPSLLPDRAFRCEPTVRAGRIIRADQFAHAAFHGPKAVLAGTPLEAAAYGNLFAYATRRFGFPSMAGSPDKDLAAGWLLTTPDPDVFLRLSPSPSGAAFSMLAYVAGAPDAEGAAVPLEGDRLATVVSAYKAAVTDLLRPVRVGDAFVNALGPVDSEDPLTEWVETRTREYPLYEVEPHGSAGYPIPHGTAGTGPWQDLLAIVSELGRGDVAAGVAPALGILKAGLSNRILAYPEEVRVLLAGLARSQDREGGLPELSLPSEAEALASDVEEVLRAGAASRTPLPAFAGEHMDAAERLAACLGIDGEIRGPLAHAVKYRRAVGEYDLMWEAAGGDIPEALVPVPRRGLFWSPIEKDTEAFLSNLRGAGMDALVAWAERLSAEEGGRNLLHQMVHRLMDEAIKQRAAKAAGQTP